MPAEEAEPLAEPLAKAELPAVTARPVRRSGGDRDVRIQVARKNAAKLKRAVRAAKLPKATRKRVRYMRSGRTVTLVVKGPAGPATTTRAASGCAGSSGGSTAAA